MEWMKAAVEEAKATIRKAQENIMWYYNQRRSLAPAFYSGDQVFLDTTNIKTIHPSPKLLHCHLEPFIVEHQVGPFAYCLKLPHAIKKLHPMFNVVKLSTTLEDPILRRKPKPHHHPLLLMEKKSRK